MPELPNDPAMLLSYVNMQLRDNYDGSLQAMCLDWGIDVEDLKKIMNKAGWEYNPQGKRFW